jgi:hypothetical protein
VTSRKRNTIFGIALGLAVAAFAPMTASAKPVPANQDVQDHGSYQLGPGEIPVVGTSTVHAQPMELGLSQGKILALGLAEPRQPMELGLSQGKILALGLAESGSDGRAVAKSPDDRAVSRATTLDTSPSPVVSGDDGRSVDINPYTVTGFGLALVLAIGFGMGIAVWQSRRTNLSPA